MNAADKMQVVTSQRYNASAERVYDTLLDVEKARTFMFATMTGKMITAEIDPRVGGRFTFIDKRPGGTAEHYGEYVELERPRVVAFKFTVSKDATDGDLVRLDIVPLKKGCEVKLTHETSSDYEDLKERIESGWDSILDGLGAALRTR